MNTSIINFLHKASSALAIALAGLTAIQAAAPTIPAGTTGVNTYILWATAIFGALGHVGSVTAPK